MLIVLIWACAITIGILLFQKNAGTLNPCKINIISLTFYFIFVQTILGAVLTSLGFTKHYTYLRLVDPEKFAEMGAVYSIVTLLLFPIISLMLLKLLKVNPKEAYDKYLKKEIENKYSTWYFAVILGGTAVCSFFFIALLKEIGYIPIVKLFFNDGLDFAAERSSNVNLIIFGIEQIKNIMVLYAIPILSLISFSFALVTKEWRWRILFAILLIESVVVKTYDFAKAPVVIYFAIIVLIVIYVKGGLRYKILALAGSIGVAVLIVGYRLVGYSESFFDIYNGILGRTLFTQFGTLCMHLEAFTNYFGPLSGRSLYPTVLSILGMDTENHVRSAQIVMEVYNSEGIYEGNAGVMNTLFIGEAYANWGVIGILFSIVWVSIVITIVFAVFLKLRKTPVTIAFFAILTQQLTVGIQGGFVDYLYNSGIIMTVVCMGLLYYYPDAINWTINRRKVRKEKE